MLWYGVAPDEVKVVLGSHVALGEAIRIPVDERGAMQVNFAVTLEHVADSDLILAAEQTQSGHTPIIPAEQLKDALVLLGRTDREARSIALPIGRNGSRGELAAAALATIQTQRFMTPAPNYISWALALALLPLAWQARHWALWRKTAIAAGIMAAYLLAALGIFSTTQIVLPFLLPFGLLICMLTLHAFYEPHRPG